MFSFDLFNRHVALTSSSGVRMPTCKQDFQGLVWGHAKDRMHLQQTWGSLLANITLQICNRRLQTNSKLTVGKRRSSHTLWKATPKYKPFFVYAIVLSA